VLWDENDKRGWLVNGTDTVLHLLHASLNHSRNIFSSAFLPDSKTQPEKLGSTETKSVLGILSDPEARALRLYVERTVEREEEIRDDAAGTAPRTASIKEITNYRVEDRIEHLYNTLEKLIDYKADLEKAAVSRLGLPGYGASLRDRTSGTFTPVTTPSTYESAP